MAGITVRATAVPPAKLAEHVEPQSMPVGLLLTVPLPDPALVAVNVKVVGGGGAELVRATSYVAPQPPELGLQFVTLMKYVPPAGARQLICDARPLLKSSFVASTVVPSAAYSVSTVSAETP